MVGVKGLWFVGARRCLITSNKGGSRPACTLAQPCVSYGKGQWVLPTQQVLRERVLGALRSVGTLRSVKDSKGGHSMPLAWAFYPPSDALNPPTPRGVLPAPDGGFTQGGFTFEIHGGAFYPSGFTLPRSARY